MRAPATFPRVRYAQCWEDPITLSDALKIGREDDVISIASGGDNSFALLLDNPRTLTLVDSNPTQIFLVELKIQAIQTLDYEDFVAFLGARPCRDRRRLYGLLRFSLSDQARGYWDLHTEEVDRGIIHCGKFERYFSIFRQHVLPLLHGKETVRKLLAAAALEEQRTFYDEVWNSRRWQWLFRLFFGEFLLGRLGRDPSFFQYVTLNNVAEELLTRTRRALTEVLIQDNFFIEYILTGEYLRLETASPYLRETNFQCLKQSAAKMRLFTGRLEEYLATLQPGAASKFNLSDIFEYMSDSDFELTLQNILRISRKDARMAFWTLFVPRAIPPFLSGRISSSVSESQKLFAADRGFFYGSFAVWNVSKVAASRQAACISGTDNRVGDDNGPT